MHIYRDSIYSQLVDKLGNPPPIARIRQQLIPRAQGIVLEIGTGSGANFPHYDPVRVTRFYALEPNPGMNRLAQKQEQKIKLTVEYISLPGERLPLDDNTLDTVVSTFTLCTISEVEKALQGMTRVLKPTGKLIFFELGLAPDPAVQRWQKRLAPLPGGCFKV